MDFLKGHTYILKTFFNYTSHYFNNKVKYQRAPFGFYVIDQKTKKYGFIKLTYLIFLEKKV